jgi:hypothetical protein
MSAIDPPDPSSSSPPLPPSPPSPPPPPPMDPLDPLAEPKRLLNLMSGTPTGSSWMPGELGAILKHELQVPLRDIVAVSPPSEWSAADTNLRGLLAHENPPVELLEALKRLFKSASAASDDLLPKEVATVLYLAVIAAGARAGHNLTSWGQTELRQRIEWASRRQWLAPPLDKLFEQFLRDAGAGT